MLSVGCEYTARIVDCTPLGAGIAKIDGCAVFVIGAVTGEMCRFVITEVQKKYAKGRLVEIIEKSEERRDVDCRIFADCGGCTLRHTSEKFEREIKKNAVIGAFRRMKISQGLVRDVIEPSLPLRNGVKLHFDEDGAFGFYEDGTNTLCKLPENGCHIIPQSFSDIARTVSSLASSGEASSPTELFIRSSDDGNIVVCLTGVRSESDERLFVVRLMSEYPKITGILTRRAEDEKFRLLAGSKYLESTVANLRFRISPEAFFQVNYEGAELIFERVLEYASRCDFSYCADLYCGTGTIGLMLAARFPNARFTGVEINESAVRDAKYNARLNGLRNIDFYCSDAARFADERSPELVVLDPPRRGLSQSMTDVVLKILPQNIIYVSCNPFTLARDAEKLSDGGYKIYELSPINMFPRSSHVETVCLLSRTDALGDR